MEYEQMEYGRRVVMEAITRQDINSYHDLLSPDVLLVTHFPYPTSSTDSNLQTVRQWVQLTQQQPPPPQQPQSTSVKGSTAGSSRRKARELLQAQEAHRAEQKKRYEAFRKRREGHHGSGETEAHGDGVDDQSEGTGITQNATAAAVPAAAGANTAVASPGAVRADGGAAESEAGRRREASSTKAHAGVTVTPGPASLSRVPEGVRWFRQQQQQQQVQQQQRANAAAGQRNSTLTGDAAGGTPAQSTRIPGAACAAAGEDLMPYEEAVDIVEGRMLVSFRFFELLHWISSGKNVTHIAPVELDVQLRKDILQEDEVLPPPAAPQTLQEAYEQLGTQFTERNQPLSCVTVVWGREYLLFRDKMYFDDGLIVTIQRTMLSLPEMVSRAPPMREGTLQQQQQLRLSERKNGAAGGANPPRGVKNQSPLSPQAEQVYKAVEAFYGVSASRVNSVNTSWALLDYSFLDAQEPSLLLRLTPASGNIHVAKPPRVAADPRFAQGVFLNQNNDPSMAGQTNGARTLIKAKNKQGEEEAYEFNDNRHRLSVFQHDEAGGGGGGGDGAADGDDWGMPSGGGKGGKRKGATGANGTNARVTRYDASCVRISGCQLQSKLDQLVPVLRRLIANSLLTLHTLDLSQNRIATLPDLRMLPLQNLKLHDNAIADWRVVELQIAPLPFLTVLTLHGNPIAEEKEPPRLYGGTSAATTAAAAGGPFKSRAGGSTSAAAAAASNKNNVGESSYWKKLLAILMSHPARVAPLRQVDFVTLTAQDFNVAGAHALFTTGKADVLNRARTMNAGASRADAFKKTSTAKTSTAAS